MSLCRAIGNAPASVDRWIWGKDQSLDLTRFRGQSCLGGERDALAGKSVLDLTVDQIEAAAALIELDGIAARMLACPRGIKSDHLAAVAAEAKIDAIVAAGTHPSAAALAIEKTVSCQFPPAPAKAMPAAERETEWLLLTSGTTGAPKIVRHTFRSLTGAIKPNSRASRRPGAPSTTSAATAACRSPARHARRRIAGAVRRRRAGGGFSAIGWPRMASPICPARPRTGAER